MSYHKMTGISGRTANGAFKNTVRSGHWNTTSMLNLAKKMQLISNIKAYHAVADMSGKGRGGTDRNFVIRDGVFVQDPLTDQQRAENEDGDADEINEIYQNLG